jgi:hypothetical protein
MFSKLAVILAASIALVATAIPTEPAPPTVSQCNGELVCCDQKSTTNDPSAVEQLGAIGVLLQGLDVPVGLECNPISLIAIANGATWSVAFLPFDTHVADDFFV